MGIRALLRGRNRRVVLATLVLLLAGGTVAAWALSEYQEDKFHPHAVRRGLLYRSRQPNNETFRGLKRRNITQVINLRSELEDPEAYAVEANACRKHGITTVCIPIGEFVPDDRQIEQFLRAVNDNKGATLVHCAQGRTRTGVMVAAFRVVMDAWPAQQAFDEMVQHEYNPSDANRPDEILQLLERLGRQRAEWLERLAAGSR